MISLGLTEAELATVNRIGFQLASADGACVYIDDMHFGGGDLSNEDDLIGAADRIIFKSSNWVARYKADIVSSGTNDSEKALWGRYDKSASGGDTKLNFVLSYSAPLTTTEKQTFTFDMKLDKGLKSYSVYFLDVNGDTLWSATDCEATVDNNYHTYTHNVGDITGVASIKILTYFDSDGVDDRQVWIDNVYLTPTAE